MEMETWKWLLYSYLYFCPIFQKENYKKIRFQNDQFSMGTLQVDGDDLKQVEDLSAEKFENGMENHKEKRSISSVR